MTVFVPDRVIVVNGETFRVHVRETGEHDFTWLSGPNENYGFSSSAFEHTDKTIENSVRTFLSMIDPKTGYIAD